MKSDELNSLDDGEAEGEQLPGEARAPSAQEHRAGEHGLPEADHRARGAGKGYTLIVTGGLNGAL